MIKRFIVKLSEIYDNELHNMIFDTPIIFINKEKKFD
jgi:hypothetical protein